MDDVDHPRNVYPLLVGSVLEIVNAQELLVVDILSLMLLVLVENGRDLGHSLILEILKQRNPLRVSTICITMLMVVLVLLRHKALFRLSIVLGHLQFQVQNRQEADIHFLGGQNHPLLRLLRINRVIKYA